MKTNDWELLEKLLRGRASDQKLPQPADPHALRLLQAIDENPASGPGDIAGLLRTVLRSRSGFLGANADLAIPSAHWLPAIHVLREHGIDVIRHGGEEARLRARPWKPSWLGAVPDDRVYRHRINRYTIDKVPVDPVVEEMAGFAFYRSSGQAAAVRAASTMPPGSSLLVNLPTGAGKSLAFEIGFAQAAADNMGSVLVVPTTALALDQEARLRKLDGVSATAYHGGLSDARREQIRRDFRDGKLSVVISSPEALLSSLAPSLYAAATRGTLAYVVVDEAHMVSGWGIDFRPEFQLLGGFVHQLRDLAASSDKQVRTVLLSATVTQQTREDLRTVFGEFAEVAAVSIRPEPEYWRAACESKEEKFNRVIESVLHLPRPLIIYTSLREEAEELYEAVRHKCALQRIALIRGGDLGGGSQTDQVMSDWASGKLDIVVATSAFGLGIDNCDVRTVIHACLPETVDRFYQEVGRAGRDGRNSVSVLLPVTGGRDLRVARSLSRKRLITAAKGWPRWQAMRLGKRLPKDGEPLHWYVDVEQPPVGITQTSEANRLWNLRTLILMQMAGMIRLSSDDRRSETSNAEWERWIGVEIIVPRIVNDESAWREAFLRLRERRLREGKDELSRVMELLDDVSRYAGIFSRIYAPPRGVTASATGFDPVTRRDGVADDAVPPACPSVMSWRQSSRPKILEQLPTRLFFYSEGIGGRRLEALVIGLVAKGIYDLELPSWLITTRVVREIRFRHRFPIVRRLMTTPCRTNGLELQNDLPSHSLLLIDKRVSPSLADLKIRRHRRYLSDQIILVSEHILAPQASHQSLAHYLNMMSVDVLERAVLQ